MTSLACLKPVLSRYTGKLHYLFAHYKATEDYTEPDISGQMIGSVNFGNLGRYWNCSFLAFSKDESRETICCEFYKLSRFCSNNGILYFMIMDTDTSVNLPETQQSKKRLVPTIYVVAGVIVVLALAGLFIWGIVWLAQNQAENIEAVRDIFIIALALESCLFGIVLIMMLVMIVRLVNMLEFEIKPILEKTNETVGMVRGTSAFVSQNVVKPVTKASGYVAGIRRGFQALVGDPRRNLRD